MKYIKSCLIITMLAGIGYACVGDMNCDQNYNVLDIVYLANCVLADNCQEYVGACSWWCDIADMNYDGTLNILDAVELINIIMIYSDEQLARYKTIEYLEIGLFDLNL